MSEGEVVPPIPETARCDVCGVKGCTRVHVVPHYGMEPGEVVPPIPACPACGSIDRGVRRVVHAPQPDVRNVGAHLCRDAWHAGEVVPPILTAEEVEVDRVMLDGGFEPHNAQAVRWLVSHEALRAENLRLQHQADKYRAEAHLLNEERDTAEAENLRLRETLTACERAAAWALQFVTDTARKNPEVAQVYELARNAAAAARAVLAGSGVVHPEGPTVHRTPEWLIPKIVSEPDVNIDVESPTE